MARYYKITHEWAEKLGQAKAAPRHPDGMHLVTITLRNTLLAYLQEKEGLKLLPDEAFAYIGAIPLTISEARLSEAGQLRHYGSVADTEKDYEDVGYEDVSDSGNPEDNGNTENAEGSDNNDNPENTED